MKVKLRLVHQNFQFLPESFHPKQELLHFSIFHPLLFYTIFFIHCFLFTSHPTISHPFLFYFGLSGPYV